MERDLTTSESEVSKASEEGTATISEISDLRTVQHLQTSFSPTPILSTVNDSLPYHQLGGPGLERLCYSLISAHGGVPRYFGNPGQEQYGIDLIVTDGDDCTVYQCKNVSSFTLQNMGKALKLFEEKWLGRAQLPRPTKFVLCCSLPLRERKLNEEWTILEREFFDRTGVRIEVWDKEYLDSQLKNLPDVVADLFSDQAAERFCDLADWNEDLFRPVRPGSGEPMVNRYLEKKAAGQIYIGTHQTEDFTQRLERRGSLLILGLPGSGKTLTGLALAESFRSGLYRVFYINMRRDLSEDALAKGIRRRLARPTIFLIDDCHGKYDEILEGAHDRLQEVLARQPGRAMLVYVARTTPAPAGMTRADYWGFVERFKKAEAILEFSPTPALFASIAALVNPDLLGLSKVRLDRIFSLTGRDLFLLDQLLDTIKSPDEIDRFEPEHLFERTLIRYFGQPTVDRPGFMMLTALAQYEIAPQVSDFPYNLRGEDPKAAAQLMVAADHPPRYFFLHSSAAELVFRALARNYRVDHVEAAALQLIEFFSGRPATDPQLSVDLSSILRNRLKLRDDEKEEYLLKSRFLGDDRIYALVETIFDHLSLNTVALLLNTLKSADATTLDRYRDLVQRKIDDGTALKALIASFPAQFLQLIKKEYPLWYSCLQEQFATQGFRQLVRTKLMRNLLRLIVSQRDFILDGTLDSVCDEDFDGLIERTLTSGNSVGHIHLELREIKEANADLLEKLEQKIGAQRYLRLIASTGTVFELFRVIQYSSPSMAGQLIEALDNKTINDLIEKTIASRRSIGTLSFTLRELKISDPNILDKLERKIGVLRWWKLILANGKINTLAPLMQYMDDSFKQEMVQASTRLTTADWNGLLLRGDFGKLTFFVRWGAWYSSMLFTFALIKRLSPTFKKLIHAADWPTLNLSAYYLSESPDTHLKGHLQSMLDEHLAEIDIPSLRFDTFKEAAQCIILLWRRAPSKRDELVRSFFSILPKEDNWYEDANFLRAACEPLFVLATSHAQHEIDRRMLDLCNNRNVTALFARAETLHLLLYLWNLYSLWFKCERIVKNEAGASFAAFLDSEIRTCVNRIVDGRLRSRTDQSEKEHVVSLCGFLYASGFKDFSKEEKAAWLSGLPPFDELLAKADGMKSFIVASFFLVGLGWIFDRDIPRPVFSRVMSKASSYEEMTDAFSNLHRLLSARIR